MQIGEDQQAFLRPIEGAGAIRDQRHASIEELIKGSAADNEALGRLTPQVAAKLVEQRLFRLLLPRAYGGDEVDLVTWFRTMEAIARLDRDRALLEALD